MDVKTELPLTVLKGDSNARINLVESIFYAFTVNKAIHLYYPGLVSAFI